MTIDVVVPCQNMLGESPLWCPRRARLYWVDIRAPALLSDAVGAARRAASEPVRAAGEDLKRVLKLA